MAIVVDPQVAPRFYKSRSVSYAICPTFEIEQEQLIQEGTLEPVQYSERASPIVTVVKSDKMSVRICGNFKQTVHPVARLQHYSIPGLDDLFATLVGGKVSPRLT